jgi:predicted tellurium resistance membrane protein TerC
MDFTVLTTGHGLLYLLLLTLLEIVLGIDNIIFISIITDKLHPKNQKYARRIGLALALIVRLFLLTIASWMMSLTQSLFTFKGLHFFSGHSLVLLLGGIFLVYKSGQEMLENMRGHQGEDKKGKDNLKAVIIQIVMIDIVFSFDSIITAIGLTSDIKKELHADPMIIIYLAVIISMIIMLIFAKQVSDFINNRPSIKMIALGFLVMIGIVLIGEAFDLEIDKNYIYIAMAFSLIVEFMNIKMRKNHRNYTPKH